MGIFNKDKNPGAYQGNLSCPVCSSQAVRFVENVTPLRLRYRCRKCGLPFQYDISNNPDSTHPYAAYSRRKWQDIIERGLPGAPTRRKQ